MERDLYLEAEEILKGKPAREGEVRMWRDGPRKKAGKKWVPVHQGRIGGVTKPKVPIIREDSKLKQQLASIAGMQVSESKKARLAAKVKRAAQRKYAEPSPEHVQAHAGKIQAFIGRRGTPEKDPMAGPAVEALQAAQVKLQLQAESAKKHKPKAKKPYYAQSLAYIGPGASKEPVKPPKVNWTRPEANQLRQAVLFFQQHTKSHGPEGRQIVRRGHEAAHRLEQVAQGMRIGKRPSVEQEYELGQISELLKPAFDMARFRSGRDVEIGGKTPAEVKQMLAEEAAQKAGAAAALKKPKLSKEEYEALCILFKSFFDLLEKAYGLDGPEIVNIQSEGQVDKTVSKKDPERSAYYRRLRTWKPTEDQFREMAAHPATKLSAHAEDMSSKVAAGGWSGYTHANAAIAHRKAAAAWGAVHKNPPKGGAMTPQMWQDRAREMINYHEGDAEGHDEKKA